MIVFESTKEQFVSAVLNDRITEEIYEAYKRKIGKSAKPQIRSWENSMQFMYKVLSDSGIPDSAGVAIEFTIPTTSKRIDFILSGLNEDSKDSVIIIELKQWEKAEKVEGKDGIVETYVGGGLREVTHPSYQAWSYASLLEDFNETVQEDLISLYPCAYLHNYKITPDDPIMDDMYRKYLDKAPMYGAGDVLKLRDFISRYVKYGDSKNILYKINNGKIRPSKRLQDSLSQMLEGNEHFVMIDEQKVVYETAEDMARESYVDDNKRVLIVEGGPGTGKSVVAINLLVNLIKDDMVSLYVTKNSAPREVFYKQLKGGKYTQTYIKSLFKSSGSFINSKTNEFDAIIVDEAHRLNEKSGLYKNQGENQIKEIMNASKFSVFFIDEQQKVTLSDYGSIDNIKKLALEMGAELRHLKLTSQFRCNGSDGYLAWLDDVLQIKDTANYIFEFDYDFKVIDNPVQLRDMIFEKNRINNKSRLLAGYCWDWIKEGKTRSDFHDIEIDGLSMSWNLDNTQTWAIDEDSVNEIGCIHTSQGLEFDYVGVILGKDITCRDGEIITDFNQRARTDQSLRGIKKMYKENPEKALKLADEIIKNTYKTLMTRGMKGCYIYCEDKQLQEYFKQRLAIDTEDADSSYGVEVN